MRTIRLEILRHGPPHNQLLSPLTEYIALCENHQAVTLKLPFEHAEFLLRLRALQYKTDAGDFQPLELEDVARGMTAVLSQIPGLIRELAEQTGAGNEPFHLRLILSANELALLPFEIANASHGFAGAGQSLLLQSQTPVCITREVRRVATETIAWPPPPNPRILFAAAAPRGPIPLEPHILALRKVIEPWLLHHRDDAERRSRVGEHLTVLPQATLRGVEEACASGQYTHVHILAHGVPLAKGDDRRYGLALHDPMDASAVDVVEGTRLAKALRPPIKTAASGFARPVVVTLAACDAGNVGSVVGAGASIAHSLHDEGIPLVVASQFPLSFTGSVIMAEVLYAGMLWGQDPRVLLVNLRRRLKTQVPTTHDWASIVAYAAFPPNLDQELARIRMDQAFRSLEAAIHHADRMLVYDAPEDQLHAQRKRLRAARDRIEPLLAEPQRDPTTVYGLLASSEKRLAQILWRMKTAVSASTSEYRADVRDQLVSSRKYYYSAFRCDHSQVWALVQALALSAVLRYWNKNEVLSVDEWQLARILSEEELRNRDPRRLAWAYANLLELYLLVPAVTGKPPLTPAKARAEARRNFDAFRKITDLTWIEIHSTKRQLLRYTDFFAQVNPELQPLAAQARQFANLLPESAVFA
jgi:hypothetical protein